MKNKKTRRYLLRMSQRLGITFDEAVFKFYGIKSLSELDRNLVWSLYSDSFRMGRHVSRESRKKKNEKKKRDNEFLRNNPKPNGKGPVHIHDPRES